MGLVHHANQIGLCDLLCNIKCHMIFYVRYMGLTFILEGHLYLSGVCWGVDQRMNTKYTYIKPILDYVLEQN